LVIEKMIEAGSVEGTMTLLYKEVTDGDKEDEQVPKLR
jgi:hypothetical protein